ncbi:MAG: hypothetical protein AAGH15_22775 [Myxococcota bacterium]
MKRLMKILHELGSYGLVGAFLVQLLLVQRGGGAMEDAIVSEVAKWIAFPSLLLVVISGLGAMIVRPTFWTKGWVWLKVLLTAPTLYVVVATHPAFASLETAKMGPPLVLVLVASIVITFLSVWRPRGLLGLR